MDWTEIIIAAISGGAISGGILRFLTIKPATKKAMAEAKNGCVFPLLWYNSFKQSLKHWKNACRREAPPAAERQRHFSQ